MPLDIELEPGEEIVLEETLPAASENDPAFSVVVSNRALFLQRKKRFAVSDPWYFDKVPLARVRQVLVAAHNPAWLWAFSPVMVVVGLGGLYLAITGRDLVRHEQLFGYSLAFIIVGFAIPWALRSGLRLRVEMTDGRFSWTPRLTVGGTYGEDSRRFLLRFADACRGVGLLVQTPGSGLGPDQPGGDLAATSTREPEVERADRPRLGWRKGLAVGLGLYAMFVALCFYMEIEARERFRVASEADVAAIDDRAQQIRAEAARGLALGAMWAWPPYAVYSTGVEVLFLLGLAIGVVLAAVGVRAAWRRMRPVSVLGFQLMIVAVLLFLSLVALLLAYPPYLAERYVEGQRTTFVKGS